MGSFYYPEGATTVNEGELRLKSTTTDKVFGSYDMAVVGTGVLSGRGTLHNIAVNSGATLHPGLVSSSTLLGAISSANGIYCYAGSKLHFTLFANKNGGTDVDGGVTRTYMNVASTLSLEGDLVIDAKSAYLKNAKVGDTFVLWIAKKFEGTPTTVTLPTLPEGLEWDTTDLYKPTGVLKVVVSTGISNLKSDVTFNGIVYTTNGIKIGNIVTTRAKAQADIKALGVIPGIYVVRGAQGGVLKVMVK